MRHEILFVLPDALIIGERLPAQGLRGSLFLGRKASLGAKILFFRLDFDRFEGALTYVMLDVLRRFGEIFNVGPGYNFCATNIGSRDNDVRGTIIVRHQGPVMFVSAGF